MFVLSISAYAQDNSQTKCYKIGVWDNSIPSQAAISIVEEIYERNNLCYELINTSLEKARHDILVNTLDANIWRSDAFIEKNKQEIVHTSPLFALGVSIYANTQRLGSKLDKSQFKGKRIGFYHGDLHVKNEIEALNAKAVHSESNQHTIKAFINQRVDAIVITPLLFQAHKTSIPSDMIIEEIPLTSLHYRHILHKDNAALIPSLNAAIAKALERETLEERIERFKSTSKSD